MMKLKKLKEKKTMLSIQLLIDTNRVMISAQKYFANENCQIQLKINRHLELFGLFLTCHQCI